MGHPADQCILDNEAGRARSVGEDRPMRAYRTPPSASHAARSSRRHEEWRISCSLLDSGLRPYMQSEALQDIAFHLMGDASAPRGSRIARLRSMWGETVGSADRKTGRSPCTRWAASSRPTTISLGIRAQLTRRSAGARWRPDGAPRDPSGAMTPSAIGRLKAIDSFGLRLPRPPHSECPPDSRLAVARQHR
jgi:hypothetical protein